MNADTPNPYAPPSSEPLPPQATEFRQFPLASPWIRLGSALIDGLINVAIFYLIRFILGTPAWLDRSPQPNEKQWGPVILGILIFYGVHWYWLSLNGQTIGKKLTKIRIATMSGEKPSMTDLVLKRYGFMNLLSLIPVVGGLVGLVNVLCIFRKDHRCLHDQVAGTQVVRIVE